MSILLNHFEQITLVSAAKPDGGRCKPIGPTKEKSKLCLPFRLPTKGLGALPQTPLKVLFREKAP